MPPPKIGCARDHQGQIALRLAKHRGFPADVAWWLRALPALGGAVLVVGLYFVEQRSVMAIVALCAVVLLVQLSTGPLVSYAMNRRGGVGDFGKNTEGIEADDLRVRSHKARLACFGTLRELEDMLGIRGHVFEPRVPELASEFVPAYGRYCALAVFLVFVFRNQPYWLSVLAALIVWWCFWVLARLRRVYFRVYPGSLDVLRAGFWGGEMRLMRSVNLREAKVTCRYDKRKLSIVPQETEREGTLTVELESLAAPHAFVRTVFEAALVDAGPARPPTTQLAG